MRELDALEVDLQKTFELCIASSGWMGGHRDGQSSHNHCSGLHSIDDLFELPEIVFVFTDIVGSTGMAAFNPSLYRYTHTHCPHAHQNGP